MKTVPQVEIVLNGKRLLIDLENLRDSDLAKRDKNGVFEVNGEHHFTRTNAVKAARKVGKRLFTNDEFRELCKCETILDAKKKGYWFIIPTSDGNTVEVFFPVAGFRSNRNGDDAFMGWCGYYWSSEPFGGRKHNGLHLDYFGAAVNLVGWERYGLSLRCVQDVK